MDRWLRASGQPKSLDVRGVIDLHAGYSYSGCCAAFSFASIDPESMSHVFLLGPSHHYYTPKCAISRAIVYKTPLGDITIDLKVKEELRETRKFEVMDLQVDEVEHIMEMHLPYLSKKNQEWPVKIVPILSVLSALRVRQCMDVYWPSMLMIQKCFSLCHLIFPIGGAI